MSDFAFLETPPRERSRQEHYRDVIRESLRHKIKHLHDDAESAMEYATMLRRAGGDPEEELKEMEAFAASLRLVIAMFRTKPEQE